VILDEILAQTRQDLGGRKALIPTDRLPARAAPLQPGIFERRLRTPGVSVIAEIKRASPSKGPIRPDLEPAEIARLYSQAGVAAISCLTEPHRFHGSLADLALTKQAAGVPVLRKDFLVDEYQLDEAVAFGADAVLLIVAALEPTELRGLLAAADQRGLDALVEAHTAEEARVALAAGARVLGVNNRDLRTFEVDLATTGRIVETVPRGNAVLVAESGISSIADLATLASWGVDAVLVGEHFMRREDVCAAARTFVEAGRQL
jgi:indole-3-glycerol phosphate synthase